MRERKALRCNTFWGPLTFYGARVEITKHVVFYPERNYILQGGITLSFGLSFHIFDETRSVMIWCVVQTVEALFTSVPAIRLISGGRQIVGAVFTSVPATRLIRCRHQTLGVVFTSVRAIRLIRGGRQTVEAMFTSVPATRLIRCRHQTAGVVFTSVPVANIEVCC